MISTLKRHRPIASIGIPVYNGERYLSKAINSVQNQTISDIEIIISDNSSTDRTQAICEDFANQDNRIRYIRQKQNIGAPRNWNTVALEAKGKYFKWASASDYCDPAMLEKCMQAMQNDPDIVLSYGRTMLVDENEKHIEICENDRSYDEKRPGRRLESIFKHLALNNAQCGVFKLDVLRRTRLDRLYPSGDIALMAELVLHGTFRMLPDVLLFRCQSKKTFTSMLPRIELQKIYDPDAKVPMKLIFTRRYLDIFSSIARSPIPIFEKCLAYRIAMKYARWERNKIGRELLSILSLK